MMMGGLSVAMLLILRHGAVYRAATTFVVLTLVGSLQLLPWADVGLGFMQSFRFETLLRGMPAFCLVLVCLAFGQLRRNESPAARRLGLILILAAVAPALGAVAEWKIRNAVNLLGESGAAVLSNIPNLVPEADASMPRPRAVALPYRFPPNVLAAYDIPSLGGYYNLHPYAMGRFWEQMVLAPIGGRLRNGQFYVTYKWQADFKCCRDYRLADLARLELLRLAGVGRVISYVPLTDTELELLSGPGDGSVPPRGNTPFATKLRDYIDRIFEPGSVYVYELRNPVPWAYGAGVESARDRKGPDRAESFSSRDPAP